MIICHHEAVGGYPADWLEARGREVGPSDSDRRPLERQLAFSTSDSDNKERMQHTNDGDVIAQVSMKICRCYSTL